MNLALSATVSMASAALVPCNVFAFFPNMEKLQEMNKIAVVSQPSIEPNVITWKFSIPKGAFFFSRLSMLRWAGRSLSWSGQVPSQCLMVCWLVLWVKNWKTSIRATTGVDETLGLNISEWENNCSPSLHQESWTCMDKYKDLALCGTVLQQCLLIRRSSRCSLWCRLCWSSKEQSCLLHSLSWFARGR